MSNLNDTRIEIDSESIKPQSSHTADAASQTRQEVAPTVDGPKDFPKMWECSDPYQFPIPKAEGDCWSTVLEEKLKGDRIQCDAWKDEVQNLLIFAGLFSAVVTAFITESYKELQPSPNDTIILLLNGVVNGTGTLPPPVFSRSASTIRVNIFWFLSLILSLATVLVGIISLQWLREHQRYTVDITQRRALSVFHMRAQGLEAWYVRQIFTGLPLLLQSALVLFLLGIVDFLFAIDFIVAVVVTVGIGFTLLFLVATTVLPTLQLFIPTGRNLNHQHRCEKSQSIPVQCPYRSPQSWIFYRFSSLVYQMFHRLRLASSVIITENLSLFPFRFALSSSQDYNFKSWIFFDSWWLTIPEVYMTRPDAHRHSSRYEQDDVRGLREIVSMHPSKATLPTYIEAESLLDALKTYSSSHNTACALYHCVQEVSVGSSRMEQQRKRHALFELYYIKGEHKLLANHWAPSRLLGNLSDLWTLFRPCIYDEHMIWFVVVLMAYGCPQSLQTLLLSHLTELNTRSSSYLLTQNRKCFADYDNEHMSWRGRNAFPGAENVPPGHSLPDEIVDASATQFYLIFDSFIRRTSEVTKDANMQGTTYNEPLLEIFLSVPTKLRREMQNPQSGLCLPKILQQTLQFISRRLQQAVAEDDPRPLLFLSASVFMNKIFALLEKDDVWVSESGTGSYRMQLTGFESWGSDAEPVLSLAGALSKYFDHFKPSLQPPFTVENIYIWKVGLRSELTRIAIPVTPV